jgi:UPF0716 family protein affecting phage T7 exclusion
MILVAGILLLLPGFLTDILGILLFIPPVREMVWRFLKTRINVVTSFGSSAGRYGGSRGARTIDLDPDEYSSGGHLIRIRPGGGSIETNNAPPNRPLKLVLPQWPW